MLKYVVIQLCDSAPSFCNYETKACVQPCLMPLDTLKKSVIWALKQNLSIQYLLPAYPLPEEYKTVISSYENTIMAPLKSESKSAVHIMASIEDSEDLSAKNIVVRVTIDELSRYLETIKKWVSRSNRINIIVKDVETLDTEHEKVYRSTLMFLADFIIEEFVSGKNPSVNILTDRLFLDKMNNCNAGVDFVTVAPDGKFYLCPAFYMEKEAIGSLEKGLSIPNSQLLHLDHAPICRICDAYHCRRCVWMNRHLTFEINTPGHEQCVLAHIEQNVSSYISDRLISAGIIPYNRCIQKCECLDPFYKLPRIQLK